MIPKWGIVREELIPSEFEFLIIQIFLRIQMDKIRDNFTQWLKNNGIESLPTEKFVCFSIPTFFYPLNFSDMNFGKNVFIIYSFGKNSFIIYYIGKYSLFIYYFGKNSYHRNCTNNWKSFWRTITSTSGQHLWDFSTYQPTLPNSSGT